MDQYRTSGVWDENAYREISRFAVSRSRIWFMRVFAAVMMLFTLFMLLAQNHAYTIFFAVFAVLFAIGPMLIRKRYLHGALKLLRETYPDGFVRMESFFTVDGLSLHNLNSGGQHVLPYGSIWQMRETEHYFFLRTRANQFTLIFKDCLTPEQQESLAPFLRERCPQLKILR